MLHSRKRCTFTRSYLNIFDSLVPEVHKYSCIHKCTHILEKEYKLLLIYVYMHCVCCVCMLKEQSIFDMENTQEILSINKISQIYTMYTQTVCVKKKGLKYMINQLKQQWTKGPSTCISLHLTILIFTTILPHSSNVKKK